MGSAARSTLSLYVSEAEIAAKVLGPRRAKEWPAIAVIWEREGLPRVDPFAGGRYWPAVRAFLDRRHGLRAANVPISADGDENWS
jgi:hypothetical protein